MAEIIKASFDYIATAQLGEALQGSYSAGTSTASIAVGAYGRNATSGVRIAKAGAGTGANCQTPLANLATVVWGIALKGTGADLPVMELVDNATVQCSIYLRSDGRLEARGPTGVLATGSATISSTGHRYVEVKATINNASGRIIVKVDGVTTDIDTGAGGVDTQATANAYATLLRFGEAGSTSATYTYDLDDLYVYDTTGGAQDDFAGDVRVECLTVTGAGGSTQFTPSTGSNYQNVDDATPDDDSTYNASSTVGHLDRFAMSNLVTTAGSVLSVTSVVRAKKDNSGARTLHNHVYLSTATTPTQESADLTPTTSYAYHRSTHRLDGDGAAWSVTKVNALELGYEVQA